jgi:uncharacterized protein YceK
MKNITIVFVLGVFLIGCAASQISLTASAPKGKDLDITIKTSEKQETQ